MLLVWSWPRWGSSPSSAGQKHAELKSNQQLRRTRAGPDLRLRKPYARFVVTKLVFDRRFRFDGMGPCPNLPQKDS